MTPSRSHPSRRAPARDARVRRPTSDAVTFRQRQLPHWRQEGAVYFATFTTRTRETLCPTERTVVLNACMHWHKRRAWVYVAVVMPDHAHLILQPSEGFSLETLLHSLKSFSAHTIQRSRRARGSLWMDESMDRILRSEQELEEKLRYVWENPVRAGLVERPEDYPWLFVADPP